MCLMGPGPCLAGKGVALERASKEVRKKGGRIVERHLLVVEREAEEAASQQLPACPHCRGRTRLSHANLRPLLPTYSHLSISFCKECWRAILQS